MASNTSTPTGVLYEDDILVEPPPKDPNYKDDYVIELIWWNVIVLTTIHVSSFYGLYLVFTSAKLFTLIFATFMYFFSFFGVIVAAHRLWAHKSFKANLPLRLLLATMNSSAAHFSVFHWVKDHRLHHKYVNTDADPYSASRGFFYSQLGWLACKAHPDVEAKLKEIDISDLESDPILAFQYKYYNVLMPITCFILPTVIPVVYWDETWTNAFLIPAMLRFTLTLNSVGLVNSAAHMYGYRPYDKNITAVENLSVSIVALGEGWHNYHHSFPWDYKASEFGRLNFSTNFIDFFAMIGWAYDLKTVSDHVLQSRMKRTGDGSPAVRVWDDKDQTQEEGDQTTNNHVKIQ